MKKQDKNFHKSIADSNGFNLFTKNGEWLIERQPLHATETFLDTKFIALISI